MRRIVLKLILLIFGLAVSVNMLFGKVLFTPFEPSLESPAKRSLKLRLVKQRSPDRVRFH